MFISRRALCLLALAGIVLVLAHGTFFIVGVPLED